MKITETVTYMYTVQRKLKSNEWCTISCPLNDYNGALYIYKSAKNCNPDIEFRMQKITTTKRVEIVSIL